MLIMERLIVLYDSCMILFVAFCIVVCNHMLTLQMPLSFFILLSKLNYSQIWLVLKLFKNLGEDIFNPKDLRWAMQFQDKIAYIWKQNCPHFMIWNMIWASWNFSAFLPQLHMARVNQQLTNSPWRMDGKMEPDINSFDVHPQLGHNSIQWTVVPLVGPGSLCPFMWQLEKSLLP